MTNKLITALAISIFLITTGSIACAKSYKGEVTKVDGDAVTITLSKKEVKKISVGDTAKISVKKAVAPSSGSSALTGC